MMILIQELGILAYFDQHTTRDTKERMVHVVTNITTEEHLTRRAFVDPCGIQKAMIV